MIFDILINKLLVICGSTATGKTSLALNLARQFNGELINADSRQVYRGLDIITGKDIPFNSKFEISPPAGGLKLGISRIDLHVGYRVKDDIPIWLVDVVNPDYTFNVGEYQKLARIVIDDILKRKKLPIMVGGTGLYIRSIIDPLLFVQIPPHNSLRDQLSQLTLVQLQKRLQDADHDRWNAMNSSDRANPRRLIRAIEISLFLQSTSTQSMVNTTEKAYASLVIGLKAGREYLSQRINERVNARIKGGAVSELQDLLKKGYTIRMPSMSATGYRQLTDYIENRLTLDEAIKCWKFSEHSYAKRQMTWFKKNKSIKWFDITVSNYIQKIEDKVEKWYTS